jgi:prolyl 4-hydroxylase
VIGNGQAAIAQARALRQEGRTGEAEQLLRRVAAEGSIEGAAELGLQLFLAPPPVSAPAIREAMDHIFAAAKAGHASSAHLASLIAAHDPSISQHWDRALDFAAHAAGLGLGLAQFELAFLSSDREAVTQLGSGRPLSADTWSRLRNGIDVPSLLSGPRGLRVLSPSPYIAIAEGFASHAMCDWIIRRAKPALKKGKGYITQPGAPVLRTNSEVEYGFHELDLIHAAVRQRIANLTGLPLGGLEPPSVFHYAPGEEFTPHWDYLNPEIPVLAAEIARTGQCVATVLIYLSDGFEAGETEFVDLGIKAKGRKGDALIFHNVDQNGIPDIRTRHAGRAPTRGEKWLFSQFIRNTRQANKLPG